MRGISSKTLAAGLFAVVITFGFAPYASASDDSSIARPLILQKVDETQLVQLPSAGHAQMKTATDEGRASSGMPMPKMQLLLKRSPEAQQALEMVLAATRNPDSPMYRQTLTPTDYAETFGVAQADLDMLQQWLESHGLQVTAIDSGKLAITFKGTAAQVEEAFHTEIHNYKTTDARIHYANASAARVPATFADVVAGVNGLDNFSVLREANYDGLVVDPKAAEARPVPAAPTEIVRREKSIEPESAQEGIFPSSGNIVTSLQSDEMGGRPDAGVATSMSVGVVPNTVTYGAVSNVAITATMTWSGGGTPTGSVTFYDAENYLYEQILLTSCTASTGTYICVFNWNGAGAVGASPDTISAAYLGDTTYSPSTGTTQLIIQYPHTSGTSDNFFSSFTDAPGDQNYGTSTPQTVTVTTFGFAITPPTGNILVTGNGSINEIGNITPIVNYFCFIFCYSSSSIPWNPYAYLQPGIYTLTATYSGDNNYADAAATTTFTVNGTGTTADSTTVTANPNVVSTATPGTTFTTVTSWTSGGAAPTGEVSISGPNGTGLGSAIFPITGATSSTGGGTYNGGADTFTFTCNTVGKTITCVIVDSNVYAPLPYIGANTVTATYGGNSVYAASSGTTIVYKSANLASTLTVAGNPTQGIYGEGTSITYTATVVGGTNLAAPTGTVNFSGTTITGSPLSATLGSCSFANHRYTCTASVTAIIPYLTAPNGYAVTATYLGDINYGSQTNTTTETVVKQTPSLTAPTLTPNTEAQGSIGPVVLSTSFTWLGSGAAPTGGVTFLVDGNTVGTAVCSGSGDAQTCTYSYNPSALGLGTHAVTAKYAGDGNYNAVTSGSTTLTISTPTVVPTLALTSSLYGTTAAGVPTGTQITLTATLTVGTNNGAWGGIVTFVDATTGVTIGTGAVTGGATSKTATATFAFTPTGLTSATYPAGFNQFTATYAGSTNYSAAGPASAAPVYLAGVLYSLTLGHNFSVNPGTYDGAQVGNCTNGLTTTTCTEPYLIQVYNFTTTTQSLALTFTNAPSGAFGNSLSCGTTLAAGATCNYSFFYQPPQGDGCVLNATTCTQGTYEAGSWKVVTASATNTGVGQLGFPGTSPRSGPTTFPSTLAGKALLPTGSLSVSPLSYTFSSTAAGTPSNTLTIIVTNPNTSPVPFTYTGPTTPFTAQNTCNSPLQAGASCNIYVTMQGNTANTYSSSVVIKPANASTITSAFSGTILTNNGLTLSTNYHNFGNVNLNTTSVFGLGITNNSGATQPVTVTYSAAAGYTVANGCTATLAANQTCTVTVSFTPTSVGQTYNDTVTIGSDVSIVPGGTGSGSSYSSVVSFTGVGAGSGEFTATSVKHNFGAIPVGTSGGNYGVQLSNNTASTVTFTLGPLSTTAGGFSLVATTCGTSLTVNGNCELIFTFTPNATGSVSATYPIVSSSPLYSGGVLVSPSQISLSGTGQ